MARQQHITRDQILDQAYALAESEGISNLNVRKLANACGVSVGSIYNYFPAKADLSTAVIDRFWREAFYEDFCKPEPQEPFIDYVRRLFNAMEQALAAFQANWIQEIRLLPADEREAGRQLEATRLAHIAHGLASVLRNDKGIRQLPQDTTPEELCSFIADSIIGSIRRGGDCRALFSLIEQALYW